MKQMPGGTDRSRRADVDQPSGRSTIESAHLSQVEAGTVHEPGAE
jgi:hypothetical protein